MLADILNQPHIVVIENKQYSFEYDHAALAVLEKRTGKSPYAIYDMIVQKNQVMIEDTLSLTHCAMLKHHDTDDILKIEEKLIQHPGFWYEIKEDVVASFAAPMLPPEILRAIAQKENSKKKPRKRELQRNEV